MTRRRFIADEAGPDSAILAGDHAHHLIRVLRAKIGQEFDISVGGRVRQGTVKSVSDDCVEFALGAEISAKTAPELALVLAIFKFDRMEWAIEKCTEIGVSRMVPLIARRTDQHLAGAAAKRRDRWERIARQASEQSRRAKPPEISAPVKFKDLDDMARGSAETSRIVLAESEKETRLKDAVRGQIPTVLAIGPEGGWTDDELAYFQSSGWEFASLGETILRSETAAIVASAIALDCLR